jgi:predicted metal-dependent hydrolase
MNTQQRWNYIKNNKEIIEQHMAQHDEEAQTRKLKKFLGAKIMDFDIEYLVIRLHDIAREIEQKIGVGELSKDIRSCADRLGDCNKAVR